MHPATKEFLEFLRMLANSLGAVLIFDEVVTSRLAFHGLQGYHGVKPDMTTLGKYLGGGLPFGAFGGKREIMEQFDPRAQVRETLHHSGTFNNNIFTMSAAVAAAGLVTDEEINRINVLGDRAREGINDIVEGTGLSGKLVATGMGSCIGIHFYGEEADVVQHLFYYHHLQRGLWIGQRGFLALSFAHGEEDIEGILTAVKGFVDEYI
jgi:glutamate-1-semialdehyde 2,1-aminomutase